jgi:hypothetical protein
VTHHAPSPAASRESTASRSATCAPSAADGAIGDRPSVGSFRVEALRTGRLFEAGEDALPDRGGTADGCGEFRGGSERIDGPSIDEEACAKVGVFVGGVAEAKARRFRRRVTRVGKRGHRVVETAGAGRREDPGVEKRFGQRGADFGGECPPAGPRAAREEATEGLAKIPAPPRREGRREASQAWTRRRAGRPCEGAR